MDATLLYVFPFFFLLIGIELWIAKKRKQNYYRFNDAITNLNIGIGNQVTGLFFKVVYLGLYYYISEHWALFHLKATVWTWLACLLLFDFIFYWAHRWGHTVNFFWGAHVVHHSSEEYNLSVALRQPWFHNLIAFFLFLPIPFLGFEPMVFLSAAAVHTLYQFWIHTKAIGKLWKPIEYIFNTPSHHRVHHAVDPKYIDKNYAGVFMVWDRLFGTFAEEKEEPHYGITTPLKSWNPMWANFHYYVEMFQKAKKMSKWKDRLYMIVARPGWLPQEMGGYQAPKPLDENAYVKYDAATSKPFNRYVFVQFASIVTGTSAFIYHFNSISAFYKIVFLGILILSIMICGAIFENKPWVIAAEYARLLLVILSLNTFYYYWHLDWFIVMLVASLLLFVVFVLWFTKSWVFTKREVQMA
ncbi:MAG TPA: sterol desaturase family protein [Chitinophagales bacterium]|nr:sterol desaturase family protein [Chitinophagales bacterium]